MVLWSPDSKKIATQQQDERNVGEMYFVNTTVGHPTLRVSKFPLPGDPVMAMLHRVVVDVDSGRITAHRRLGVSGRSAGTNLEIDAALTRPHYSG
jgi:dipeptidyl-peptidase-4